MAVPQGSVKDQTPTVGTAVGTRSRKVVLSSQHLIHWPKLAADAEAVNGEHDDCSALPSPGPGLCSTARKRGKE